jgi:hypothetical protein
MRKYILILFLLLITLGILAVEVGGHISRDTVWSPQHNPYVITSFLYIDSDVTLTILPGTQVLGVGAPKSYAHHFEWSGTNNNTPPNAKMIIVNGTINAIGTADNPIIFDKYQEDSEYRWGGIYLTSNAPISTFEYCEFNNGMVCDYEPSERAYATLEFGNGLVNINNCSFADNYIALESSNLMMDLVIYKCSFYTNDVYSPPFVSSEAISIGTSVENPPDEDYDLVIARCYFTGNASSIYLIGAVKALYLFSVYDNLVSKKEPDKTIEWDYASVSAYGNYAYNGTIGWGCWSSDSTDVVFARKNTLVKTNINLHPMNLYSGGFGTNYVSDNYLAGNTQVTATATEGNDSYIYNNIIETTYPGSSTLEFERQSTSSTGGQIRFFNNLVRYTGTTPPTPQLVTTRDTSPFVYNNTFVNYHTLLNGLGDCQPVFTNNIIDVSFSYGDVYGSIIEFIYNCTTIPIPDWSECYYVENNIYADPLFADTLNHDYFLSPLSPCRDVGASRPDLPDFDIRYNKRIAGGSGDNPGVIDIGAYEYGSAYIGGLRGNVYDANTGEPVDCAKIEILGKLPEFSDTLGNFAYPSGAGTYSVKVSRWDYEDLIIPDVIVVEVLDLMLDIPLVKTEDVANQDDEVQTYNGLAFGLKNYPNPFNPETTISYYITKKGNVTVDIYNLKGQKVKSLFSGMQEAGKHDLVWKGDNDDGKQVSSGTYLYRVKNMEEEFVKKMLLMK